MVEGSGRQVNGVRIGAGRAIVRDNHDDAFAVLGVDDLHLLPAEGGCTTTITIPSLIF